MTRIFPLAAAACLISQAAVAHAFVQHASPGANSDLPAAPAAVTITFSENVHPHDLLCENSHLHQVGRTGRQLSVGLPKLSVGKYTVIWSATSTDTHRIEGRFDFQVSP